MTTVFPFPWPSAAESQIRSCLQEGRTIVFPTETIYALGGNAWSAPLVERIFQIKQRPRQKPLPLLIDPQWLPRFSIGTSILIEELIRQFWPGPLTLIVPADPDLPRFLKSPHETVAIRHSNSPVVQKLISAGRCPLIGTSANLSNSPENQRPSEVLNQLDDAIDLLIDGGKTPGVQPSTIVDTTKRPFRIVRAGLISSKVLQPYLQ